MGRPVTARSGGSAAKAAKMPPVRAAATTSATAGRTTSSTLRTPVNGRIMRGDLTAEGLMTKTLRLLPVLLAIAAPAGAQQVTFAKDIAPILQKSCQSCHRPGQMAPMSLLTYQDVRPWARSIKQRVTERAMPPWGIDPHVGLQSFKNDPTLRDDEVAKIVKWVDAGAPMGNVADMPKPREFDDSDRWHIGKPDLIVTSPKHVV